MHFHPQAVSLFIFILKWSVYSFSSSSSQFIHFLPQAVSLCIFILAVSLFIFILKRSVYASSSSQFMHFYPQPVSLVIFILKSSAYSFRKGWLLSGFWNCSQGFGVLPGFWSYSQGFGVKCKKCIRPFMKSPLKRLLKNLLCSDICRKKNRNISLSSL